MIFFLSETAFHLTSLAIEETYVTYIFSIFHSNSSFRWSFYRHFDPNSIFKMHDTPLLSTIYFSEVTGNLDKTDYQLLLDNFFKHFETNGRILRILETVEFYFELFIFFLKTDVIFLILRQNWNIDDWTTLKNIIE